MIPNRHCEERSDEATFGPCLTRNKVSSTSYRTGEGTFFTPGARAIAREKQISKFNPAWLDLYNNV